MRRSLTNLIFELRGNAILCYQSLPIYSNGSLPYTRPLARLSSTVTRQLSRCSAGLANKHQSRSGQGSEARFRQPLISKPSAALASKTARRCFVTSRKWTSQLETHPSLSTSTQNVGETTGNQAHTEEGVTIRIIDYSDKDTQRHEVDHSSIAAYLKDNPKPDWATCRWVYVNGIDHDVLRSLGSAYKLHQLALEDVLESRGPTKADWYDGHLFIAMPLHKLLSPTALEEEHKQKEKATHYHRFHHHQKDWRTIAHQKFNVAVEQASIFWTNTDTVITIFQKSGNDVFEPILDRLDATHSVLRSTNDPSMLVQGVIDVAVDLCMPIEKVFADEFAEIELTVLSNPAIQQSRSLYILRSRLTLLLDNFIAINSLLRKLCGDHPLSSHSSSLPGTTGGRDRLNLGNNEFYPAGRLSASQVARSVTLSSTTQLYLRDVLDHVHTLSASTEVAIRSTENLTSLIFNTIAASQNESVRQLTVVSSFFLPLTFLTGYMGMNFETMPVVQEHSDLVFWGIAAPAMIVMGLFMRIRMARRLELSRAWRTRMKKSTK